MYGVPRDSGSDREAGGTFDHDEKREKNKEASRRFRERKKATERALTEENALLRDEMEQLRRKLASTHVDVGSAMGNMHACMRAAIEHLKTSLPAALMSNIQRALTARKTAVATATHLVKELKHIIPPIAYSEMHMFVMLTWLRISEPGHPEPEDPVEKEIYHMWGQPGDRVYASPEQLQEHRAFFTLHSERYRQVMERRRRLRLLLEEAAVLGAEVESDDAWFAYTFEPFSMRVLRPEQLAGRIAWMDAHLPMLQDHVLGYRLEQLVPESLPESAKPKTESPVPPQTGSPAARLPTLAPHPPALTPRTPVPVPPAAAPAPRKRAADPPPARPAPAPSARPDPAPAGAGVPPDVLRDLIREAVTKEVRTPVPFAASSLRGGSWRTSCATRRSRRRRRRRSRPPPARPPSAASSRPPRRPTRRPLPRRSPSAACGRRPSPPPRPTGPRASRRPPPRPTCPGSSRRSPSRRPSPSSAPPSPSCPSTCSPRPRPSLPTCSRGRITVGNYS